MEKLKRGAIWTLKAIGAIVALLLAAHLHSEYGGGFWAALAVGVGYWHLTGRIDRLQRSVDSVHGSINEIRFPRVRDDD